MDPEFTFDDSPYTLYLIYLAAFLMDAAVRAADGQPPLEAPSNLHCVLQMRDEYDVLVHSRTAAERSKPHHRPALDIKQQERKRNKKGILGQQPCRKVTSTKQWEIIDKIRESGGFRLLDKERQDQVLSDINVYEPKRTMQQLTKIFDNKNRYRKV
jgi:hypothetical protein